MVGKIAKKFFPIEKSMGKSGGMSVFMEYTKLVAECKSRKGTNTIVEDCKKDVAVRLTESISLDDIAKDLRIEKAYLAKLFKKAEGISVGEYIRKEKMNLAANMLTYSDHSITEIAHHLGYESGSLKDRFSHF